MCRRPRGSKGLGREAVGGLAPISPYCSIGDVICGNQLEYKFGQFICVCACDSFEVIAASVREREPAQNFVERGLPAQNWAA